VGIVWVGITIKSISGLLKRCFGSETTGTVGQSAWTFAASLLEITASSIPESRQSEEREMFYSRTHNQ
jgi:hypothetical protein